ncbi:EAL domain-containing protein [Aliidiomarina halalkaliphila]|uniref:EAL domain-containing protein n=1 Tax=Aliidiomarina halalkaliphila TaxID=2593535 RepID=A0A552X318_9GAMM|nr:EAL domain-containing protein [Aliidiomarina halalkaliphila]TRW49432.1 EAL domain-containing protein [Aliidiomarina halalkaliphila]
MNISFQSRLILLLTGFSGLALLTITLAIMWSTQVSVQQNSERELDVSERVFKELLEVREGQLRQGAAILADDFGFRQAVTSADEDTIISALLNHGQRIDAQLMTLFSATGDIIVSSHDIEEYRWTRNLDVRRQESGLLRAEGQLYQSVVVPVRAPQVVAWVLFGFPVDTTLAVQLEALTNSFVSFIYRENAGEPLVISSKSPELQEQLKYELQTSEEALQEWSKGANLYLRWLPMETLAASSGDAESNLKVLLAASLENAQAPFNTLRTQLWIIALLTMVLAIFIALLLGRHVVQPVKALVEVVKGIGRGDYQQHIETTRRDEIGQLAQGFSHMQTAIAEREQRISYQLLHDDLTELPNARQLHDEVLARLAKADRFQLAILNWRNFRQLNSMYGPTVCDDLLKALAQRLRDSCNADIFVARLQGDEFVLLLPEPSHDTAMHQLNVLLQQLNQPIQVRKVQYSVQLNAGLVAAPEHGREFDVLIRYAQFALAHGRRKKLMVTAYTDGLDLAYIRTLAISAALPKALARNEFHLVYQPKIAINAGSCTGVEALLRWQSEELGWIGPDEFIPVAEQSGLIHEITAWVCTQAIEQVATWHQQGHKLKVSVNFSANDLLHDTVLTTFEEQLKVHHLDPTYFVLEVTEGAVVENPELTSQRLKSLREKGFGVSIDDYGTGYSSLLQLRDLQATELKIDRSFVMKLEHNVADQTIVRSSIQMAHQLGLHVVAEGVETERAAGLLSDWGCDELQGYFYSKPLEPHYFMQWYLQHQAQVKENS